MHNPITITNTLNNDQRYAITATGCSGTSALLDIEISTNIEATA